VSVADLLDELEHEARERSIGLEALGKLPSGYTAQHYPLTRREQRELRRLSAALNAATDADTFVALCRGLPVPAARLNSHVVRFQRKINDVRD